MQHQRNGLDISFWQTGHLTYGACVSLCNLIIMFKHNNYTGWGEFFAIASALSFYIVLLVENYLNFFPQVYRMFPSTFNQPIVYLSFLLTMFSASVF